MSIDPVDGAAARCALLREDLDGCPVPTATRSTLADGSQSAAFRWYFDDESSINALLVFDINPGQSVFSLIVVYPKQTPNHVYTFTTLDGLMDEIAVFLRAFTLAARSGRHVRFEDTP